MNEQKEDVNDVNYIKKHSCPNGLCPNHEKIYCKAHKRFYCLHYFCNGCLKEIKIPKLNRNTDKINIRIKR